MPRHLPLCVLMRDMDVEALATAPFSGAGYYKVPKVIERT